MANVVGIGTIGFGPSPGTSRAFEFVRSGPSRPPCRRTSRHRPSAVRHPPASRTRPVRSRPHPRHRGRCSFRPAARDPTRRSCRRRRRTASAHPSVPWPRRAGSQSARAVEDQRSVGGGRIRRRQRCEHAHRRAIGADLVDLVVGRVAKDHPGANPFVPGERMHRVSSTSLGMRANSRSGEPGGWAPTRSSSRCSRRRGTASPSRRCCPRSFVGAVEYPKAHGGRSGLRRGHDRNNRRHEPGEDGASNEQPRHRSVRPPRA